MCLCTLAHDFVPRFIPPFLQCYLGMALMCWHAPVDCHVVKLACGMLWCVCTYICIYMCIHTHICIYIYTYIYTYKYICHNMCQCNV